ncbi:MAG: DUF3488 domain-containing protein [Phycisphaerales bacterium]|nr:DUF3488 domain-containing protein [Phycisphaerales bacterium]
MRVDRLYYIVSTITVVLGLLTFAAASGSVATAFVLILSMAAAHIYTTGENARRVPKWFTSTLAIGALAYGIGAMVGASATTMVLHVARTIAVLQVVKVLEPRTPRNQAQLLALSGMLTVGSCLTSVGFRMALALSVYAPLMLASVMLFQLYSAEHRADPTRSPLRRVRATRAALAGVRSVGIATALGIAGVAAGSFIAMPRGLLDDTGPATPGLKRDVSGFTDHVRLGGEGIITDSEVVVMDVKVREFNGDGTTRRRGRSEDWKPALPEVLYLRGAVLDTYEPERGIWTRSNTIAERDDHHYQNPRYLSHLYRAPSSETESETFVQIITVRSRASDHLFALSRPDQGGIVFERGIEEFTFNSIDRTFAIPERRGLFTYTVRSIPNGDISPADSASFPVGEVREYALQVLTDHGFARDPSAVSTSDDKRMIDALARHLRNNPDFTYTRQMTPPPPGVDPIVDFLRVSRAGHCEYFASALAAMCRSVGIHARVVTGYAVSEYNPQDTSYTVRESNAHAWVEAMTAPGRWETFDASPAEEVRYGRPGAQGLRAVWLNLNESIRFAWLKWVVGFGEGDQVNIFRIDSGGPFGIFNRVKSAARSTGLISHQAMPRLTPDRAARAALWALITLVSTLGGLYGVHWILAHLGLMPKLSFRRGSRRHYDRTVYGRMLALLDRAGLTKPDATPPLTHARRLASIDGSIADDVGAITRLYYASRFGNETLDLSAVNNRLDALREYLKSRG